MNPSILYIFYLFKKRLILMVPVSNIFFVEDEYVVKRLRHFRALFIAELFSRLGTKKRPYLHPSFANRDKTTQYDYTNLFISALHTLH